MDRLFGIEEQPARAQLQGSVAGSGKQPLPQPYRPGVVTAGDVGITDPGAELSFFVLGDVGGVKTPGPQNAVSVAIEQRQDEAAFGLILGDVVYFNGQQAGLVEGLQTGYGDQFYEPYAKFAQPILAFPGNHDGDPEPEDTSLAGFMANFCDQKAQAPQDDPHMEFGRHTQTLPYCDWTLNLEAVTIVAIYTNVPAGGHLEPEQIDWLTEQLGTAREKTPVIVGMHHPPYSVDSHHGGSERMGKVLDQAIEDSKRTPSLVLSGHVHDYQRFTRQFDGQPVPYIVSGNGGYHNLHKLAKDAAPGEELAAGVVFEYGDASRYGFVKLTVAGETVKGEYVGVKPGVMPDGSDAEITPALDTF